MHYIFQFLLLQAFVFSQFAIPTFQAASSIDRTSPRITITATDGSNTVANGSTTNDNTLTITFTSNETTSNFIVSDIGVVGGSISSFSGSDQVYTATFTPSSNRLTKIYIPTGSFTDGMSNNNYASEIFKWTYDSSVPLFTRTTLAADNSTVNVQLSETVFNSSSGAGALEVADFSFTLLLPFTGNPATLNSSTPSSIAKSVPTFTDNTIDGDLNGVTSIFTADLDQDGDIDVIAPAHLGSNLCWYQNNGSQSFTKYTIDNSLTGAREAIVTDLDRDGDMDVIAIAEGGDQLVWYDNNGSQSFTKTTIDASIDGPRGIAAADLDGDNDVDILLDAYNDDVVVWYDNNGFESFTKNIIVSDAGFRPFVIDLDKDGDMDIVNPDASSDELLWFENNGAASFTERTIDGNIDNPRGVSVADLDEDGDLDIVTVSYDDDDVVWYANNGSESFTKSTIDADLDGSYDAVIADIDNDGDLDIGAVGMLADDVVWYANNGSESFTKYIVESNIDKPYRIQIADVDLDGDLDILSHGYNDDDVAWYQNVDGGYDLGVSLSGTAIGTEVLTVSPASSSIYDKGGNVASTSQSNNTLSLNDKTGPTMTITAANSSGTVVSDGATTSDSYLVVTFTSNETTTNFALADISVSGGSMASFSGSGTTYTANFTPSSSGATTVDVAGSTFTDASGNNNSAATQFNWTYDGAVPTITGNSLASDNSTIAVTFSEAVYNTSGGSGSLEVGDFSLVISGSGTMASLVSSTPSSISASSNTYTLGVNLSGIANGRETLTVSPNSTSIYDIVGNAASTSQSNNTATLNNMNYVLDLDGSSEYVSIANNSAFQPSAFTVQAWVNLDAEANGTTRYFVHRHKTWYIGMNDNGTKFIGAVRDSDNNAWQEPESTTNPDPDAGWYQVVLTFESSVSKLYVNGGTSDVNTINTSGYATNSQTTIVAIGAKYNAGTTNFFDGQIDEVAFWNEALTASEITALYNSGYGLSASANSGNYTSSSNLVSYYQMQSNLNDTQGNHNGSNGNGISSSNYSNAVIQ